MTKNKKKGNERPSDFRNYSYEYSYSSPETFGYHAEDFDSW